MGNDASIASVSMSQPTNKTVSKQLYTASTATLTSKQVSINLPAETHNSLVDQSLDATFFNANRKDVNLSTSSCNLKMQKNEEAGRYNTAGNVRLEIDVPMTSNVPNYVDNILDYKEIKDDSVTMIDILFSMFFDKDLLCKYFYKPTSKIANDVLNNNLSSVIKDPWLTHGWNYNRDWDTNEAKNILNYHFSKLNEIIDYVIKTSSERPDATFKNLWCSLFGDYNTNKVYSHAIGTLLMPSLVNYFASVDTTLHQANSYIGTLKANAKFFPIADGTDPNTITYHSETANKKKLNDINVPCDFNNNVGSKASKYNNPLIAKNRTRSLVVDAPSSSSNLISHRTIAFTKDNYTWHSANNTINSADFAVQEAFKMSTKNIATRPVTKNQTYNITVACTELATGTKFTVPNAWKKERTVTVTSSCKVLFVSSGSWQRSAEARIVVNNTISGWTLDDISKSSADSKLINIVLNHIKKTASLNNQFKNPKIVKINSRSITTGHGAGRKIVKDTDMNAKCYTQFTDHISYEAGFNCSRGSANYNNIKEDGTIGSRLGAMSHTTNIGIKISVDIEHDGTEVKSVFKGSLGREVMGSNQADRSPAKKIETICFYKNSKDYAMITDYTYKCWFSTLRDDRVLKIAAKEFYNFVKSHPDLSLMYNVNKEFGNNLREMCKLNNVFAGTIPVNSLVVSVPRSYITQYKHYIPSFNYSTITLNECNHNGKESNTKDNVHVIKSIIPLENSNNYLDLFMKAVARSTFIETTFDGNDMFCVLLPTGGHQMFEVIDKSIISMLPDNYVVRHCKYNDPNAVVHKNSKAMIVFSYKNLGADNNAKTLLSKFKHMATISVPIFYVKRDSKRNQLRVVYNSLNEDNENKVYVYISNDAVQELSAKCENKPVNNIKNEILQVSYKGANLNTATCLQLHFE